MIDWLGKNKYLLIVSLQCAILLVAVIMTAAHRRKPARWKKERAALESALKELAKKASLYRRASERVAREQASYRRKLARSNKDLARAHKSLLSDYKVYRRLLRGTWTAASEVRQAVSLKTRDGWTIHALYRLRLGAARRYPTPAVVVSHRQHVIGLPSVSEALLGAGYAVIELHHRGHGRSVSTKQGSIAPNETGICTFGKKQLEEAVLDIEAAVEWLDRRPEVSGKRIGVIGMGWGGSLAWAATGRAPKIWAAVAIQPWDGIDGSLGPGHGAAPFKPGRVMFIVRKDAPPKQRKAVGRFFERSAGPRFVFEVPTEDHRRPIEEWESVKDAFLRWLGSRLGPPPKKGAPAVKPGRDDPSPAKARPETRPGLKAPKREEPTTSSAKKARPSKARQPGPTSRPVTTRPATSKPTSKPVGGLGSKPVPAEPPSEPAAP